MSSANADGVMSEWLTIADAARLVGRAERTLRRQCDSGQVAARKVGGVWLVDSAALPNDGRRRQDRVGDGRSRPEVSPVSRSVDSELISTIELERFAQAAETERLRLRVELLEQENRFLRDRVAGLGADVALRSAEAAKLAHTIAEIMNGRVVTAGEVTP